MKLNKTKVLLYIIVFLTILSLISFVYTLIQYLSKENNPNSNKTNNTNIQNSEYNINNEIISIDEDSSIRIITDYDGSIFKGHKSLIFFWASWCSHCQEELDVLKTAISDYQDKGFKIFLISHDNDVNELAESMKVNDLNYEVYFDEQRIIRKNINPEASSVPLTYILNVDGKLVDSYEGAITLEELDNLMNRN